MTIRDAINLTIDAIQGCVSLAKNTISATVNGVVYLFTHFPEVLNKMWQIFKSSLELGQHLMMLGLRALKHIALNCFKALKYIALNLPEVLRELYDLAREIVMHLPEIIKFFGYTLPKFFLYEVPKAAIRYLIDHLPAIANWFVTHLPELIAHGVGVAIGLVYAPFKIIFDCLRDGLNYLFGKNNTNTQRKTANHSDESVVEELVAGGLLDAQLMMESFKCEISDIEHQQNTHLPDYKRQSSFQMSQGSSLPSNHSAPKFR